MALPDPACVLGFTEQQPAQIMLVDLDVYRQWAVGKTQGHCEGEPFCDQAHGVIHYEDDVRRFQRQIISERRFEPGLSS